ncbi:MAG: tetratricopeptide repeat protein [Desulfatiglandales bacterium]
MLKPIPFWIVILSLSALWASTGCYKNLVEKTPEPGKTWSCDEEADKAMALQDWQTGMLLHERFLEKSPTNALAMYHLGYAYGQIGDHRREVFYYEKAIASGFITERIYFNLGMACGELAETEKSISAFKKALELNPENPDNHFGLAMAYDQEGVNAGLAEEEFLKALEIDPTHSEARLYLGMLYADEGEIPKACQQLREILRIDPADERARRILEHIEKE